MDDKMLKARDKLLKRIETEGYKPLQSTIDKYEITGVEPKPKPQKKKRDPEKVAQYARDNFRKHAYEYGRRNIIYKIAHGIQVTEKTKVKYNLPLDIHPLHPLCRKNVTVT